MYIYVKFNYLAYTCQDFYHPASILVNTDGLLVSNLCHLASTLTNTDDMLKINLCYLVNTLTNINDKANEFTRKSLVASNQLFTPHH